MRSLQLCSALMATVFTGSFVFCAPMQAGNKDGAIDRQMRAKIQAGIKAHGQMFSGPEVVPPALLKAIEGKRLVGLGEGTHGTAEIQTLHGNIILALAKKGRVLVLLEDQFGSVAPLNAFVQGTGVDVDLEGLMKGLYGVHRTLEFQNFFLAVRKFNATAQPGEKIEIYGVDDIVFAGLADVAPGLQAFSTENSLKLDAQIAICASYINDQNAHTPEAMAKGHTNQLRYGGGCRDQSFVLPYDLAVIHSALLARQIRLDANSPNANGYIFSNAPIPGGIECHVFPVGAPRTIELNGWTILWDELLREDLRARRSAALPNETGGVLLGYADQFSRKIYIVDSLATPNDSVEDLGSFKRGCNGLLAEVEEVQNRTGGIVGYIGDWHSHPMGYGTQPSSLDLKVCEWMRTEITDHGLPVLMLIIGDSQENWLLANTSGNPSPASALISQISQA